MTALTWLPAELRAWGLEVVEVTGWESRKRPGAFGPVGVLIHHTAAPGPKDAPSLQVCVDGRRDLPGPLCQLLVARSGKVYVISAGRCNHAGAGGPINPSGIEPIGKDQGNRQLVGIEAENDGIGEPWPVVQLDAMVRATAAVLDALDQPRAYCWGHREYTSRKIDPTGIDMGAFRSLVAAARKDGTMPTTPASDAMVEQWQRDLLANGARLGDAGPDGNGADGLFGRLTLEASRVILDHRNQLLAANKTSADTIVRLTAERDAAKAEVKRLTALSSSLANKAIPAAVEVITDLRIKLNEAEAKLQGLDAGR